MWLGMDRSGPEDYGFFCKICKTWHDYLRILIRSPLAPAQNLSVALHCTLILTTAVRTHKVDLPLQTHLFPLCLSYPAQATTGLTAALHLKRGFYSTSRLFVLAVNAIWDVLLSHPPPPPSSGSILHWISNSAQPQSAPWRDFSWPPCLKSWNSFWGQTLSHSRCLSRTM